MQELKNIFREELSEIISKYLWELNSPDIRKQIADEIKSTLLDNEFSKKSKVIDRTTTEMQDNGEILFKIKEGRKEYTFELYIEKLYNDLNSDLKEEN